MLKSIQIGLFATTFVTAACGVQSDDQYHGDPLVTLTGQVTNELTATPPDASVSLVWIHLDAQTHALEARTEQTSVTGSFPAAFMLDVLAPPPATVLNENGKVAVAVLLATDSAWGPNPNPDAPQLGLLGAAESAMLAYLPNAITPGSIGGVSSAGFHLLKVTPAVVSGDPDTFEEVPMTTPITVRMAPVEKLRLPELPFGA